MDIKATPEFREWFDGLSEYPRAQVRERLDRIRDSDHFGDSHRVRTGLFELRWKSGLRVYFGYVVGRDGRAVLLVLGGDKHGQTSDIGKAWRILARETA